jgi:hypothetical protein
LAPLHRLLHKRDAACLHGQTAFFVALQLKRREKQRVR